MQLIPRDRLVIRDRQRKQFLSGPLNELKASIIERGLLQPPVVFPIEGDQFLLVTGERRTRAMDMLAKEAKTFFCNGITIEPGTLPVLITDLATELGQKEAEFDENVVRVDLTWQERAQALADIHNLRKEANPSQTQLQTAKELAEKGSIGGLKTVGSIRENIRDSVLIVEHLNDPTISQARNANEARALILKKEEERVNAILAKRRLAALPTKPDIEVRHGDALTVLPQIDADGFDLVLSDPPYGINAGAGGFRSRTVHHHNYEDSPEYARSVVQCILTEGFRICKPRANLFLFVDIKNWDWLQRISAQIGWTPFPRPAFWIKSDSEGLAPWGSAGFRITSELIFYATKGSKGLLASPTDTFRINRVSRSERIHAAEKPVELLRKLIECSTLPGDRIIDPCCGSGSTLVAAKELNRRALGIEVDENYYNTAMSNVHGGGNG